MTDNISLLLILFISTQFSDLYIFNIKTQCLVILVNVYDNSLRKLI